MQHKTKTNNELDVTSIEKSVWSKPEIEVIDIGTTAGVKFFNGVESTPTSPSGPS
ncbi:hypothetical protein H5202_12075 [Shewanella sp. SG41-4]|uniref:hypothetical protein n=1 Tax=Shewanella sp. SG41-4 TaxID=2760976 RepID=UPI0016022BA7|nr:hypothetical protein [Shewanella sp. SG41-4]MBB1439405.1 hypothetical protein [Shewanella sp. SG41-4]